MHRRPAIGVTVSAVDLDDELGASLETVAVHVDRFCEALIVRDV